MSEQDTAHKMTEFEIRQLTTQLTTGSDAGNVIGFFPLWQAHQPKT